MRLKERHEIVMRNINSDKIKKIKMAKYIQYTIPSNKYNGLRFYRLNYVFTFSQVSYKRIIKNTQY